MERGATSPTLVPKATGRIVFLTAAQSTLDFDRTHQNHIGPTKIESFLEDQPKPEYFSKDPPIEIYFLKKWALRLWDGDLRGTLNYINQMKRPNST